ncbi:alpha-ketoglutarate-dependent dioxygenase AlkB [Flavobacterium sp.]|uniref:alpha-ketoglutarate-dependent dioxygenase AlkB n=1 Tax=Flavobacterium sp. TaxID=239 RepID=UPI002EDBB3F4
MNNQDFFVSTVSLEKNLFDELSNSVDFENVAKGRIGNHLVKISDKGIPIVRTTTLYTIPAHDFGPIHQQILQSINDTNQIDFANELDFNNALIEMYDCNYSKMKYHSDQCMDLEPDSYIGLFTCYENPSQLTDRLLRRLKIKNKETEEEFEIPLQHNSIVLFSLETNTKYLHKIVLESFSGLKSSESDNRWLGITLRKSKTFIHFNDGKPYFPNGELLVLADDEQKKEFFKLRGEENNNINFVYPKMPYTLSLGDTMLPK